MRTIVDNTHPAMLIHMHDVLEQEGLSPPIFDEALYVGAISWPEFVQLNLGGKIVATYAKGFGIENLIEVRGVDFTPRDGQVLCFRKGGELVVEGDTVQDFHLRAYKLDSCEYRHSSSSGRMHVRQLGSETVESLYPTVFDCFLVRVS